MNNVHVAEHHASHPNMGAVFNEAHLLHKLRHYLPSQAPLKDFVHHNTLHAFEHQPFFEALNQASTSFGYKTSFTIKEYRQLYKKGKISHSILAKVIGKKYGQAKQELWLNNALHTPFAEHIDARIGQLRNHWKNHCHIDLDSLVHPLLFKLLNSFLDQGVAIWQFPTAQLPFLDAIREMEKNGFGSFFKTKRAKTLLFSSNLSITSLLQILVEDETLYESYVFDQQFAHPGWSGMVATIETQPETLLERRTISLSDLIILELLLEIDALEDRFGPKWNSLKNHVKDKTSEILSTVAPNLRSGVIEIWQKAYEWTFYDEVLKGISDARKISNKTKVEKKLPDDFQALFCIDDRECSIRRHIEKLAPNSQTFGTPGFFGVEFYFKPEGGKFHTKVCPNPITPKYLIKEIGSTNKIKTDPHYNSHSHRLFTGWLIAQSLGFISAIKLLINLFKPSISLATSSAFAHVDQNAQLSIEFDPKNATEDGLQIGFTIDEMAERVYNVLKSIGLVKDFAPIIYVMGHGSTSTNNTHYAGYDCGACSGRPGSVNARAFSHMANHKDVREQLLIMGLEIPDSTIFIGGLHDTTRDEFSYYLPAQMQEMQQKKHLLNAQMFEQALDLNAKERARRFELEKRNGLASKVHEQVKLRSLRLFEPRPELNHATNALCIVGRPALTKSLFLDRRSFLNSYNCQVDPDGRFLAKILNAATPVCGGINLEYYFSRVDKEKLGAGSKLPHNVMGLIGVANGIEGDLRTGLPFQMTEVHDPLRLLMIVEHYPEVVLETIKSNENTYNWYLNNWVLLVAVHPTQDSFYLFENGQFVPYETTLSALTQIDNLEKVMESELENLPVFVMNN